MKSVLALTIIGAVSANFDLLASDPAWNPALARHVNSVAKNWVATEESPGIFRNLTHGEAMKLMGARTDGKKRDFVTYAKGFKAPASFDARSHWPRCPTIGFIRDQSACGSCWAFGAAESISDRYCTYFGESTPSARNVSISAMELMSCCTSCGNGCNGGFPEAAWEYWVQNGLTTNKCDPYPFPHCEHHIPKNHYDPCPTSIYPTPACPSKCEDGSPFNQATRFRGASSYQVSASDYMEELMTHGPFEVTMSVYQDFEHYRSGVYRHVSGPLMGGHAIRIVGWGTENGEDYWLIANSWNSDWGLGGFFKILRGVNECGIEDGGSAGVPSKPQH